ncbi:MAG: hypothetical protein OEZ48_09150 [Candidatus Bathyarchaeota archaeon]|nr:hypothetical protein [Candidatus Bathyarchaeota archaeon]
MIKLNLRVLAVPLGFRFMLTLIPTLNFFVHTTTYLTPEQTIFLDRIWNVVGFFLNPVLLSAVSYYATKRMELRYDDYSVIISLLLGSLVVSVALAVYWLFWLLIADPLPFSPPTNIAFAVSALLRAISEGLQMFFVSFTAMTMASILAS